MKHKKIIYFLILFLGVLVVAQWWISRTQNKMPLEVAFLDVGQGDATLINYQGSNQVLIDGGSNGNKLLNELGKVMPASDRKIEVVILTHADYDHLAGLIDLLKTYEIGIFLDNGQKADSAIFRELEQVIRERNIKTEAILTGTSIEINQELQLKVLNPDQPSVSTDDRNGDSVVVRLDYGSNSFLFTGDAEEETEKEMLADDDQIDVDWLKVSHHGSKGASSLNYLKKVSPQTAIISVGKDNRYRHPHEQALQRLNEVGAKIIRTDEIGTILIDCPSVQGKCEQIK